MISVIRRPIVVRSFRSLREQRIHPLFAGYLHLQQLAWTSGRSANLTPNFKQFFDKFFRVKDHPVGTPYIKPFTNQKPSEQNLWLNDNVAGSYATSSLRPGQPFRKVVEISDRGYYSLRHGHAKLAFTYLLYGKPIPATDLAAFLFRDFGFQQDSPSLEDLVRVFAMEFGYSSLSGSPLHTNLEVLYHVPEIREGDDVFETFSPDYVTPETLGTEGREIGLTPDHVRSLTSTDLLSEGNAPRSEGRPLREIRVTGLLSFGEETTFRFGRLNLLVGPNGSGKSNLIDCLRIVAGTPTDIQSTFAKSGFESWLYNGMNKELGSGTIVVIALLPGHAHQVCHELKLVPRQSRASIEEQITSDKDTSGQVFPFFVGSYRSAGVLSVSGPGKRRRQRELAPKDYNHFQSIVSQIRDVVQYPEITALAKFYSNFRIYSEWSFGRASRLRDSAAAGRSDARLSEAMDDLPIALNALEQTAAHEKILKLLPELKQDYKDFVTRILFGRVGLELIEGKFKLPIPAARLSDGTLRFLALAAILLQPDPPPLICIEEPELGMHPDMIVVVAQMIVEAASTTQLIVTTHSEHLLTALEDYFDSLFTFDSGPRGSVVQRLSREEFQGWRLEHSLGDVWSSGELGGVRY